MRVLRSIGAVVLGLIVANAVTLAVEWGGHVIYPPPPGLDFHDPDSVRAAMAEMPQGALVLVLVAWAVGILAGAWVAARTAGQAQIGPGLVIGALMLVLAVVNLSMIPHPVWIWVLGLALPLPCAYLGARLAAPARERVQFPEKP